jgi:hypothetical protein
VAPTGSERSRKKVSLDSSSVSPTRVMATVFERRLPANRILPDRPMKSPGALAVPS